MNSRRIPLVLIAGALLLALAFWLRRDVPPSAPALNPTAPPAAKVTDPAPPPSAPVPATSLAGTSAAAPVSPAQDLNSPRYDITHDLVLLNDVFTNWRLDYPRAGNPFGGDNAEITAALTGQNPLRIAYIPRTHPALNAQGELCDRWGTPFRFHALAGDRMELRSAGPDRKFGTADDALLTPP